MTDQLSSLGWKLFFHQQLSLEEIEQAHPARVAAVHRGHALLWDEQGERQIETGLLPEPEDIAVGDWLLMPPEGPRPLRMLERQSLLVRKSPGTRQETQNIAANLDTLFIVSSCNEDFSEARLERYLALALDAGIMPVVVLTRADECADTETFTQRAARLHAGLIVECVDARDASQLRGLRVWCGEGQTVALAGSSGVGKSTLTNQLCDARQSTSGIRESDAKGRHTTTARSMHRMLDGGLLIDTPGMRELQLPGAEEGVETLFADVLAHARRCRFSDCAHENEPGCAVREALDSGQLDTRRWRSYVKLRSEQRKNAMSLAESRRLSREQGKLYKQILDHKRGRNR